MDAQPRSLDPCCGKWNSVVSDDLGLATSLPVCTMMVVAVLHNTQWFLAQAQRLRGFLVQGAYMSAPSSSYTGLSNHCV